MLELERKMYVKPNNEAASSKKTIPVKKQNHKHFQQHISLDPADDSN